MKRTPLRTKEAEAYLGVKRTKFYELEKEGLIKRMPLPGMRHPRYDPDELDAFLNRGAPSDPIHAHSPAPASPTSSYASRQSEWDDALEKIERTKQGLPT